jgi:hypothetical protein
MATKTKAHKLAQQLRAQLATPLELTPGGVFNIEVPLQGRVFTCTVRVWADGVTLSTVAVGAVTYFRKQWGGWTLGGIPVEIKILEAL